MRGEVDCMYQALDILLESKGEGKTKTNLTIAAIIDDLKGKLQSFLTVSESVSEEELIETMRFLTQQHRLTLKEANSPDICESFALIWKLAVLTLEFAFRQTASLLSRAKKTSMEQAVEAEAQATRLLSATIADFQAKLAKSQDEIKRQSLLIDRLRSDKANLISILSDRDDEISQLKLPPNLKDFDRLLEEMTGYLAEAEGRQVSQAHMLETISVMLDTTRVKSEKKRKRRSPDGGKSPISPGFQRKDTSFSTLSSGSPPLKPQEKAFFHLMTSPDIDPTMAVTHSVKPNSSIISPIPDTVKEEPSGTIPSEGSASGPEFTEQLIQTELTGDAEEGLHRRKPMVSVPVSPLFKELERVQRRQPSMSENAVFRFMEQVAEEKFKLDLFRESAQQPYDPLPDFLLSHLYTLSGLKSVVGKTLSGLLSGLEKLASSAHSYGRLLCRLLSIYDCGSIPNDLEVFLTKTQAAFCRIYPNYMKQNADMGGSAPLVEISDLISLLFAARWESAGRVLAECCPMELSEIDVAGMLICGKLGKLGRDLKYFFIQIDTEKCGTVTYKAFAEGIRHVLGIPLTTEKMDLFWAGFQTDRLTFQQLSMLNYKELTQKADSKQALVTRFDLLTAIIHEYEYLHSLEHSRLLTLFRQNDTNGDGILTLDEFRDLIKVLDPHASLPSIVLLFRKALDSTTDSLDEANIDAMVPETFCQVAIEQRLGGAGKLGFDVRLKDCDPILRQILERGNEKMGGKSAVKKKTKKVV